MALLDVQFCMATAAAYVLERWKSSGGVVAPIPAAPYPTETYHTKMMWWDRRTFANHGEPDQVAKILAEMSNVTQLAYDEWRTVAGPGDRSLTDDIPSAGLRPAGATVIDPNDPE